tara:strand:- start:1144 stop:2211 length:1068 start_codon:yes stop_codon:yes gene_type:complete
MINKIAVIGGGFFGCLISLKISEIDNIEVDLFEEKKDLLLSASGKNQMRAHYGYHYPRSNETVKEIQKSINEFKAFFPKNVFEKTINYYSIAKKNSKTDTKTYKNFLKKNKLYFTEENNLPYFEKNNIERIFKVNEKIINIFKARTFLKKRISKNKKINLHLNRKFTDKNTKNYRFVIYATYSENNYNIRKFKNKLKKKKYELVEKILVKMPKFFNKKSIVVLDGNFVCIDPYLGTNLHLLSDVKNSKLEIQYKRFYKFKSYQKKYLKKYLIKNKKISNFRNFIKNSSKYLPILKEAKYYGSFYVVRSIDKDNNDTRVTNINKINNKLFTIYSGKWINSVATAKKVKKILIKIKK